MSSESSVPKPRSVAEGAVHNFVEDSFNCAEAIVEAVGRDEGLEPRALTPMAAAFGGGIGSLGHICGALSGGLMMLGRRATARGLPRPEIRARAQELYHRFERTFGAVDCRTLTDHDCNAAGGYAYDIRNCAKYIRLATDAVLELSAPAAAAEKAG